MSRRNEREYQKKYNAVFKAYVGIRRKKKENPTQEDMETAGYPRSTIEYYWKSLLNLEKAAFKKYPNLYDHDHRVGRRKNRKKELLEEVAKLRKKLGRPLSIKDLTEKCNQNVIQKHFGGIAQASELARQRHPEAFHDIPISELLQHPKTLARLREAVDGYSKFFVTTAVLGCNVDKKFLASIERWCKDEGGKLLVLTQADPAKRNQRADEIGYLDKAIQGAVIVSEDTALNSNIHISTIKLSAKHIDPITGLSRLGQREGSFIYASPKQRLKAVPTSNTELPHMIMTTGAVTESDYNTDKYLSERTATIAAHDHVMGGIIVEVVDDNSYHFRQVQADENGKFIDLGYEWSSKGYKEVKAAALVCGDWHAGDTNPDVIKATKEMIAYLNPETIVLHDLFDGKSINHHEKDQLILKASRALRGELSLMSEFKQVAEDLDMLSELCSNIVVVKSNHDEFLSRYLQAGLYVRDHENHRVSLQLALAMLDGDDPIQYGVEELVGLERPENVRWLTRDEDLKIARIQLGAHGDKGSNGARGSLKSMEQAYGLSVTGHTHSPEIIRGAWQVGTSSHLKLTYNVGPSSWLNTHCVVYPNGSRQLLNMINGEWKLETDD